MSQKVGAEKGMGMAVILFSPVISCINALHIHGYDGDVLKGTLNSSCQNSSESF